MIVDLNAPFELEFGLASSPTHQLINYQSPIANYEPLLA